MQCCMDVMLHWIVKIRGVLMMSNYGALVEREWQRKTEILVTRPDLELNPWLHSERPVTICLSNDTSLLQYMITIIHIFVEELRHFTNAAGNECVCIFFFKKKHKPCLIQLKMYIQGFCSNFSRKWHTQYWRTVLPSNCSVLWRHM